MIGGIDFTSSSPEDRATLLGPIFRDIFVYSHRPSSRDASLAVTVVHLDGERIALVGDPEEAIFAYLRDGAVLQ